jgi:hypothetical protein
MVLMLTWKSYTIVLRYLLRYLCTWLTLVGHNFIPHSTIVHATCTTLVFMGFVHSCAAVVASVHLASREWVRQLCRRRKAFAFIIYSRLAQTFLSLPCIVNTASRSALSKGKKLSACDFGDVKWDLERKTSTCPRTRLTRCQTQMADDAPFEATNASNTSTRHIRHGRIALLST